MLEKKVRNINVKSDGDMLRLLRKYDTGRREEFQAKALKNLNFICSRRKERRTN